MGGLGASECSPSRAAWCGRAGRGTLEVGGTGRRVARTIAAACVSASARVTDPSSRPRVAAKPLLVVASASKPSDSSSFADVPRVGQQQRLRAVMQRQEAPRRRGLPAVAHQLHPSDACSSGSGSIGRPRRRISKCVGQPIVRALPVAPLEQIRWPVATRSPTRSRGLRRRWKYQ